MCIRVREQIVNALRELAVAAAFLTRLPLSVREINDRDLARSLAYFPVVGLALGAGLFAIAWLLRGHLSSSLAAVVVVALLAALTGGLHLDGVADVFDGLAGGRNDRERTLTIMRDSRIGAHGAVAVVLVLLAKTAALAEVLDGDARVLLVFPALARWVVVPQVLWFPYLRAEGVGAGFKRYATSRELFLATVFLVVVIASVGGVLEAAAVAAGVALGFAAWMQYRLGGMTGDVYGATIEIAEVAFLMACCSSQG